MTVYLVASAHEVEIRNGRMMGNLLHINRAAIEKALVGFSQNWVEGLLGAECHRAPRYLEDDQLLEPLQWSHGATCFEQSRSMAYVPCYTNQPRLTAADLNRK